MKINKKWLSILLAMLMLLSFLPCTVSAAGNWTETVLTQEVKASDKGFSPIGNDSTRLTVFEWYYDFPEVDPNSTDPEKYGLYDRYYAYNHVLTSGLGFTTYDSVSINKLNTASTKIETLGNQRIHVIELLDTTTKIRRIWINGVEWLNCPKSTMYLGEGASACFTNVTEGTVAFADPSTYPIADFDASGYAAQLTSSDSDVIVGGTKLNSTATDLALNHTLTLKKKMTVAELTDVLTASTGAQISVLNARGSIANDADQVEDDFAVQVTSQNDRVIVKYNVTMDLKWPVIPFVFENTDTEGAKEFIIYDDGEINSDNPFLNPEKAYVFDYTYTPTATSTADAANQNNSNTDYAQGAGVTVSLDGGVGWTPVVFTETGIYENAPISSGTTGDGTTLVGQERVGETYHVTAVVKQDSADTLIYSKIFINGAELTGGRVYSDIFNKTNGVAKLFVGNGVRGTLSEVDLDVYDNFSTYYEAYQAQVTSTLENVTISADMANGNPFQNFVIDLTNAGEMTASELLAGIEVPNEATANIMLAGEPVDDAELVQRPMELVVTSANGKVTLTYTIIAPVKQIQSETYTIVDSEKTISGILRYTPAEEFIAAVSLVGAQEIVGVETAEGTPVAGYISDGMRLKIINDEGEPALYTLILSEVWTSFEDSDGNAQIKDIKGKINGKTTLVSGSIDIPAGGIGENLGLYFQLDNGNPDYVIQFTQEGKIAVWGNEIGNWKAGAGYDYAIVTNPQEGTCNAYINGLKLLDGVSLKGSYDADSDPWELVGGSYNPCTYGDFLLSEIYSADAFDTEYTKSKTELTASGVNVSAIIHDADTLEVSIFADESYTVGELLTALSCEDGAVITCFNSAGQEVADSEALVTTVEYLTVTSRDGRYTARYDISVSQDVLRSSEFTVSDSENTIGEFLQYTPVSALMNSITVRSDWLCLGVYRDDAPTTDDIIMAGDVLRLKKNDVVLDYALTIQGDIVSSGNEISVPGGYIKNDMVLAGKFTIPESGTYSYNFMALHSPEKALAYFFRIGHLEAEKMKNFEIWNQVLCELEAGKTYEYAIVHDQDRKRADIYLNGILLREDVYYGDYVKANSQISMLERRGSLLLNDESFRFYEIYSTDNFRYEGSVGLTSSTCSISYNPNIINVTSSSVRTVEDLLESLTFPDASVKANAKVHGQGTEITDLSTKLVSGMTLTVSNGREAVYRINVEASPITSYVFTVTDTLISYSGNLSYNDFVNHCVLADGCSLKVTTADGADVTGGSMESGMKAVSGNKTYTVNLSNTTALPSITINSIEEDEILLTSDTYRKTITANGTNIERVAVYLDGVAQVVGSVAGTYTFETSLTIGRHEIYAEVVSNNGRVETARYAVYAFDTETDRLRAARRPVVMGVRYLDETGNEILKSDRISYTDLAQIELVFNKALTENTVNTDNIKLYAGDTAVTDYEVRYVTGADAYYAVIISLSSQLAPSTDYKIVAGSGIKDSTGNTAGADTAVCFATSTMPFDVSKQRIVDENGRDITTLSGGDSAKLDVTLTNTSFEAKSGVVVLLVFEENKMVGYSITPFTIAPGTVNQTVRTNAAEIESDADGELTVYRYVWNSMEEMGTLLQQKEVYLQ